MQHTNLQQPTLPLRRIKLGRNPRTYFDDAKMDEMRATVRERGVDTPVIVRPLDDENFELIAGGRRYKAAMETRGEDYEMPVTVKYVGDEEAEEIALIENIQRAELSPGEEAFEAARLLGRCKGDREEAARRIGWSLPTLNSRLALMNCSTVVLDALNTRKIKLGHAELLAALSKENQDRVLPVIVSEGRSIADVKNLVETASCSLASAIFDKDECGNCPHNSAMQSSLFGESIATGNCTNRSCFNAKTEQQLDVTATGLREEYPVVRIVRAGDNDTRVQLVGDGPKGVGEEQMKACHACQNFGVAVSGLPDSMGKVYRGQCFDTVCNMRKVAARLQATNAATKTGDAKSKPGASGQKAGAKPGADAAPAPAVTVVAQSERVKEYRVALWRKALRREVAKDGACARQYLIAVTLAGYSRQIREETVRAIFAKITDEAPVAADLSMALALVQATNPDQQTDLILAMAIAAIDGLEVANLTQLCKHHKLDLTKHWKLDKAFLELLTKAEMKVVADELGLQAAIGGDFAKVFAKPKPELIEALLNVKDFDYVGKVLKVLKY